MATGHALPPYYLIIAYRFCDKAKNYYMYPPTWVTGSSSLEMCQRTWNECISPVATADIGAKYQYLFLEDRGCQPRDVARSVYSEELIPLPASSSIEKAQKVC